MRVSWSEGISSIVGAACLRAGIKIEVNIISVILEVGSPPLFLLIARFKSMKLVRSAIVMSEVNKSIC